MKKYLGYTKNILMKEIARSKMKKKILIRVFLYAYGMAFTSKERYSLKIRLYIHK